MKPIHFPLLILVSLMMSAKLSAQSPSLLVDGKSNNGVVLQNLKINITVCGNLAKTTWEMQFKNTTSRILEGNLAFPLKEGLSINRYALDINGKLREAVPVDRGKGVSVFEAIERRRVDPGLLEKAEGNIFRTRIYPINPNNTRTILIGYDEELNAGNNAFRYQLPMNMKDTVADFQLDIKVISSDSMPVMESSIDGSTGFDKTQRIVHSSIHKTNYVPDQPIAFYVPQTGDKPTIMVQEFENKYYFTALVDAKKDTRVKQIPSHITILWDASLSGRNRDIKKEKELLRAYLSKAGNCTVDFICFGIKIYKKETINILNGNTEILEKKIDSVPYDGATNLSCINFKDQPTGEFLLFSDGRQTLGSKDPSAGNKPVYCINSAAGADFSTLKQIAYQSGGEMINLQQVPTTTAVQQLCTEVYRFLGAAKTDALDEIYPLENTPAGNNFSVAGIATDDIEELVLNFGYGRTVTDTRKISIHPLEQECDDMEITKLYAQKKIEALDINYDKNRNEIERLGKQFGIVTRNTSLIVLETLEDYIRYEIEPPAELKEAYNRIIKQRSGMYSTKEKNNLQQSISMMNQLSEWWNPVKYTRTTRAKKSNPVTTANRHIRNRHREQSALTPTPTGAALSVTGKLTDKDGGPVAFATVKRKGTSIATVTDANGTYNITARTGDVLAFSAVGYDRLEVRVTGIVMNSSISQSRQELNEVVVTGYGTQRHTRSYSVSNISTQQYSVPTVVADENVTTALSGRTAGVNVTSQSGLTGAISNVSIRGNAGLSNSTPVYIINGKPGDINSVKADEIKSIEVLKSKESTAIYGARADNGVVVVETKNENAALYDSAVSFQWSAVNNNEPRDTAKENQQQADYIRILKHTAAADRYNKYLQLRERFFAGPVFYFETGTLFIKAGDKEKGFIILSNLAEMDAANYELYKMLGYKLKEAGYYEAAVNAFKKTLELRPEDPQSFRDYALALEDNGDHQQALDKLYEGMTKSYSDEMKRIYNGIEEIFLVEINRLISKYNRSLSLKNIPKEIIKPLPVDLRVIINWNHNNTDIDLWVTDPAGEKCLYSHNTTAAGGRLSDDFTEGFGPEQFLLKKATTGKYRIEIDYFGDQQVTISGPTTVLAEIYEHYGMPDEKRKLVTLQMEKGKSGAVFIGEVEF